MKHVKSERLKKFETELNDLEQWLKLGLVPKKDVDKHKDEITNVKAKIEEEKERLQFLKESGEAEEYITPKKVPPRPGGYNDMPTIPDIDMGETLGGNETEFDMETEAVESDTVEERDDDEEEEGKEKDEDQEEETDESYFSDRNRWRRGGIVDPDANDW